MVVGARDFDVRPAKINFARDDFQILERRWADFRQPGQLLLVKMQPVWTLLMPLICCTVVHQRRHRSHRRMDIYHRICWIR